MGSTQSKEKEMFELERKLQDSDAKPIILPLDFLKAITRDFSSLLVLGQGGFGVVYKGDLHCGKIIAVKRLIDPHSINGEMFQNEVSYLTGMRKHPNVVRFVGYCDELIPEVIIMDKKPIAAYRWEKLMCFEYVPNKSLDNHISVESSGLDWDTRYKIIKGICCGLHFLHEECHIIHLDLKPENILMNFTMRPKITDFGISRIFGDKQTRTIIHNRPGTLGYMAKEYIEKGVATKKADIFSLGVIVIEIITGSREYPDFLQGSPSAIAPYLQEFKDKVLGSWNNRIISSLMFRSEKNYMLQVEECITIALKCVDFCMDKRPTTEDIIERLNVVDMETECSSELDVHPLELCFPVEPTKFIPCSLYLTNNKDKHVMYKLTERIYNETSFLKLPMYGIVPPRSSYTLVVTTSEREILREEREADLILSTIIMDEYESYISADEYEKYFEKFKMLEKGVLMMALKATYDPRGKAICEANTALAQIISIDKTRREVLYSLDVNLTEPLILTSHRGGYIDIWNYDTRKSMGSVQMGDDVYALKFVERKQWFIAGSRDGFIYVYDYKSGAKITSFRAGEAHDFDVTSLAVHPTKPYLLSSCGMCIKLWNWDKNWKCIQTYNEQSNYTYNLTFNPKDINSFASSSTDNTIKIWSLYSLQPKYTLSEQQDRVTCLDFFTRDDRQYLISGSWDMTAKIWDMQTKACIYTLEGFTSEVTSVVSHPSIPFLIACTQLGDIHLWSATNFRLKRIVKIGGHGDPRIACLMEPTRVLIARNYTLLLMEIREEDEDSG